MLELCSVVGPSFYGQAADLILDAWVGHICQRFLAVAE